MSGSRQFAVPPRRRAAVSSVLFALAIASTASAQEPGAPVTLREHLTAMAEARLLAPETGSMARLREQLANAEALEVEARHDQAAQLLFEIAESPAYADFAETTEHDAALYALAGSLEALGAHRSAARALERILERPDADYFAPAVRRYVDVALASGELAPAIEHLTSVEADLAVDSRNELRYLRGRHAYDRGDAEAAERELGAVTRRSRFFASALYLRGAIAASAGDLPRAEARFCTIAEQREDSLTFYADERFFELKDLAQLALGRVAHEAGRADDAFYYYFRVPNDSPRVAEAIFESAYAMYEGGDHATALDLLDQLEARFPGSPFADEASLLRGYVALAHCEFDRARAELERYLARFGPLLGEIDRALASPDRQRTLFEELRRDRGTTLLTLLRVDPEFYRLHESVRSLDAETARSGRLAIDLAAIEARVAGQDVRAAAPDAPLPGPDPRDQAREAIDAMHAQLDVLRAGGADARELAELEELLPSAPTPQSTPSVSGGSNGEAAAEGRTPLLSLLARDRAHTSSLLSRAADVRARLITAANQVALRGMRALRDRLAAGVRRARLGRIDAVMGDKRQIELEIEQLSLGELPPELVDPLQARGLLRDDEEYWPFEGEDWPDEFDE